MISVEAIIFSFLIRNDKNNNIMPQVTITIVPKQVGQLWDQILEDILNDITLDYKQVPNLPLTQIIPHTYNPNHQIYIGKCHQQTTPNLCGYHATFNTLCFLNYIKRGFTSYNILSGASFWNFKKRVQTFLTETKKKHKLKDQWPFKQHDIKFGDFQRTYNKLCLDYFQDFQIFRNHQQFELFSFTWEFQYENLLISEEKRRQLNKLIQYFRAYSSQKPLIISFMLAITNHWMCLQAVKVGNQTQYWFFDSFNRNILDLSTQQIDNLVEQINEERIRIKGQGFSPFFKTNIGVCMRDTQISLKLIVDCLQGKTTLEQYIYNQQFNIFANQMEKFWDDNYEETDKVVKDYWYNIASFFKLPLQHNLFNLNNNRRFKKLVEISYEIRQCSQESKKLNQLVKKYSGQSCF